MSERQASAIRRKLGGSAPVLAALGDEMRLRLVQNTRAGRERLWELAGSSLDEARRSLALISDQWDRALGRLRRLVEE